MLRRTCRAAVAAVLVSAAAAGVGALGFAAAVRGALPAVVDGPVAEGGWTRRSRAAFTAGGFFGPERDEATGRYFSWTGAQATIEFHGLSRARAHRVELDLRSGRPEGVRPAELRVFVDGRLRYAEPIADGSSRVMVELMRADRTGASVRLEVSPAFQPGGQDPRTLGVIVDRVGVSASGAFLPSAAAWWAAGWIMFAMALSLRLCGFRGAVWFGVFVAAAAGVSWLLVQDAAFLDVYPGRLLRVGLGALAAGVLVAAVRARWPSVAGVPDWSLAAGALLAVLIVKAAVIAHPSVIVGDGLFQVHRAQVVARGEYYFTSVTPRPFFEFPYPVALYVTALPLWSWFPSELDALRLLRGLTLGAEWLAGLALYGGVRRMGAGRATGLLVCLLWPLSRAPVEALANANLTNHFGQSVFAAAAGGVAWMAAASAISWAGLAIVAVLLVIAFLSHFGTVTVGLVLLAAMGKALWLLGGAQGRRLATALLLAVLAAGAVSWVTYYSHFTEVYARTWTSVSAREADDSSKMTASPAVKLQRWWRASATTTADRVYPCSWRWWPAPRCSSAGARRQAHPCFWPGHWAG